MIILNRLKKAYLYQIGHKQTIFNHLQQDSMISRVDTIIGVENKKEFSLFENIKYLLRFWKPKPNKVIKLIKTRKGNEFSKLLYINLKTLKVS